MQEYKDAVREHLSSYVCQLRQRQAHTGRNGRKASYHGAAYSATWNVENSAFPPRH